MILNWFLLLLTAFIAYVTGSVSTRRVASRYVFKRDLMKLGRGNTWLSNFRRLFGYLGFAKLGLVEIVKDLLPLLIGALLIGFRGRPDIGRIFAGYCLMLGRLWPVFNRFKGGHGCMALILIGLLIEPSVGITAALSVAAGIWFGKSFTVGAMVGTLVMAVVAVMVVEEQLILIITALICLQMLVRHIPSIRRIFRGQEEKLSLAEDLSYKFDEKF